jgi:integrase
MPRQKRYPTKYPSVYYIMGQSLADGRPEKIFYIRYRRESRQIDEPVGRQSPPDAMTAAKASQIRVARIRGEDSNREQWEKKKWSLNKLWKEYSSQRPPGKSLDVDQGRFDLHVKPRMGSKSPDVIRTLDIDRLRRNLEAKDFSPQTVKHVLGLVKRLINFGVDKGLIDTPDLRKLKIEFPKVDNEVTEDLSNEQLGRLFKVLDEEPDKVLADVMRFALATGMRRGEIVSLQWGDVNFDRETIFIREPKGGKSQSIPMNGAAREILARQVKRGIFVFCGKNGQPLNWGIYRGFNKIKKKAGLPENFRPLHGLRHSFASGLASSGQVDLYVIQKLLTHKSPQMTKRYSHLRDEALRKGADVAANLFAKNGTHDAGGN